MARLIKVFVCDKNGYGLSGQKVKLYGDNNHVYTGKDGVAEFVVESSSLSVYVNGITAYSGSTSFAKDIIVYKKS